MAIEPQIRNTDAVVLRPTGSFALGYEQGRKIGQPDYRLLELLLRQKQVGLAEENRQDSRNAAAFNNMMSSLRAAKGNTLWAGQLNDMGYDLVDKATDLQLSDPRAAADGIRQLTARYLATEKKNQALSAAIDKIETVGSKDPYIDKTGLVNLINGLVSKKDSSGNPVIKKDMFGHDVPELEDINRIPDTVVSDLSNLKLDDLPGFTKLFNAPKMMNDFVKTLPDVMQSRATATGGVMTSASHSFAQKVKAGFTIDPGTGEAIPKYQHIQLTPQEQAEMTRQYNISGKDIRGVSEDLWNMAQSSPEMMKYLHGRVNDINRDLGYKPGDQNYILPGSQQAEDLKKVLLYQGLKLKSPSTTKSATASRLTAQGRFWQDPDSYLKEAQLKQGAKSATDVISNLIAKGVHTAVSGDDEKIQDMLNTKPVEVNIPGFKTMKVYDLTQAMQPYLSYYDQDLGKKQHYNAIASSSDYPGSLFVQKQDGSWQQVKGNDNINKFIRSQTYHTFGKTTLNKYLQGQQFEQQQQGQQGQNNTDTLNKPSQPSIKQKENVNGF